MIFILNKNLQKLNIQGINTIRLFCMYTKSSEAILCTIFFQIFCLFFMFKILPYLYFYFTRHIWILHKIGRIAPIQYSFKKKLSEVKISEPCPFKILARVCMFGIIHLIRIKHCAWIWIGKTIQLKIRFFKKQFDLCGWKIAK